MKPITIPFKSVKYILYQRTNFITHKDWLIYKICKKINILLNYDKWILIESFINKIRISNNYHKALIDEFTNLKDTLPRGCIYR